MKKFLLLVALLATTGAGYRALGWGGTGHSVIAYIAEQNLTPQAKQKCRDYLHHTLPYHASWMDYWRFYEPFAETSSWHSVPVGKDNKHLADMTDNAARQIKRICREMKRYKKLKDSIVCDNLKYLIHMVGDMHCPSHTKYLEEPHLKQGKILRKGKKDKFHAYWDQSPDIYNPKWTIEDYRKNLDTLTPAEIADICSGTVDDWATQNAVEMREIYTLLPLDTEVTELPEESHARMKAICHKQIQRGAYRLAYVLNEIFKK
ncbi:MAG: S1/P1 nuclease [Alistipes sp.]|nr:S1/P1 nuclease [Alistipes sp.]